MGLGTGIFLLVVGAILAFAVQDGISGVDLTMIGYICMAGGALAIVLTLALGSRRRAASTTVVEERGEVPPRV